MKRRPFDKVFIPVWLIAMGFSIVTACTTGTQTSETSAPPIEVAETKASAWDGFCATAKAISWSSRDTIETVAAIKEHNHLGHVHCGWPE